ncbi:hypothetical protein GCM10010299_27110 [Streptomyces tanashiensis]|nr:hypothetical protein GCM10010299_27110 [Streptomyces tanashiensis]
MVREVADADAGLYGEGAGVVRVHGGASLRCGFVVVRVRGLGAAGAFVVVPTRSAWGSPRTESGGGTIAHNRRN